MQKKPNSEERKKIGTAIYYASLVIVTLILLISLFYKDKEEDPEAMTRTRYIICFYCFGGGISFGVILREFLVDKYDLKKMIVKVVFTFVALLSGTILFVCIPGPKVALALMFLGFGVLMYNLIPSLSGNQAGSRSEGKREDKKEK